MLQFMNVVKIDVVEFALSALAFFVALYVIPLILLMGKGEMTKGTNS